MNTKHLALFAQVVKTGNITQVAKNLHVSQPAISMQLKRLEQEVGVLLFTIVGRNISVTDAGLTFLEYAESILSLEGQIYRSMEEFRIGNRGEIVIGASPVAGTYLLPKLLLSFTKTYPDILVEIETGTDEEIERSVRVGNIDVGLTLKEPEDHLAFRVTRYSQERLIGIQPSSEFTSRMILVPGDVTVPLSVELDLDIMRLDSTEAVKQFVMEGMGYGVVLESAAKLEVTNGKLLYWREYAPYPVAANVITRPAERLSKSVWFFINHLGK
ncbi:LysR family transcriptional regulator [Bacillus sp. EB600]|uniref:LysR family transcriptional regulator n=1 Tax=Bacillus sp. EB600 TaxID=2806345 RepID=UPI002108B822|nr:LysR family transcriptional regulator [Bacillus sp. EB600]MCQ6282000.1 LysR family transcriptional regulator [Bacillus sp. EB600]